MNVSEQTDNTAATTSESAISHIERVIIRFPITVWGTDLMGKDFNEAGRTESITRNGATIVLKRLMGPHDVIRVVRNGSKDEAVARIVGQTGILPDGNLYGINVQDPNFELWGHKIPSPVRAQARSFPRAAAVSQLQDA